MNLGTQKFSARQCDFPVGERSTAFTATDEAKALLVLFCSMLNEKQRRLYAGLESLKLGHGGDAHIASILGMDPHTVAKGRKELMNADITASDRQRAKGAGRLTQEKKRRK